MQNLSPHDKLKLGKENSILDKLEENEKIYHSCNVIKVTRTGEQENRILLLTT